MLRAVAKGGTLRGDVGSLFPRTGAAASDDISLLVWQPLTPTQANTGHFLPRKSASVCCSTEGIGVCEGWQQVPLCLLVVGGEPPLCDVALARLPLEGIRPIYAAGAVCPCCLRFTAQHAFCFW